MIAGGRPNRTERCHACRREYGLTSFKNTWFHACPHCGAGPLPLLKRLVDNRNAACLAIAALLLLIPGLSGPFMEVVKLGEHDRYSLLGGVRQLMEEGRLMLGAVILLFSAAFPLAKLALILVATSSLLSLPPRIRTRLYHLAEKTAKYSLLDVVVLALLIVVVKVEGLAEVKPAWGTCCFLTAALTSMLAGLCVDASRWEASP